MAPGAEKRRRRVPEIYFDCAAQSLFGPGKRGHWTMLSAYFDESGTHDGSQFVVIAGLLAKVEEWEKLTVQWLDVLDDVGVSDFHMVDCAHGVEQFEGWTKEERGDLVKRLIPIIRQRAAYRVWSAVGMHDYRLVHERDWEEEIPYKMCAIGCASLVQWQLESDGLSDFIPYMFEQGGRGAKLAFDSFERLLEQDKNDVFQMGALSKGSREKFPPLQAADLYAYEVYNYFTDQLQGVRLKVRGSLQELFSIPKAAGGGVLFTHEVMALDQRETIRQMFAPHKEPILYQLPVHPLNAECRVKLVRSKG